MTNFNNFYHTHRNAFDGRFHGVVQIITGLKSPVKHGWWHFAYYFVKAVAGDAASYRFTDWVWGDDDN